jgi:hypothetical protein
MEMTIMQEIQKRALPSNTPPVPRGFKICTNENGVIFALAPEDKRKSRGRVAEVRPTWMLRSSDEQGTDLAWEPLKGYNTLRHRELLIAQGLKMEIKFGMRMTSKAPKCSTIVRQEYGMTGSPLALYMQFCKFRKFDIDPELAQRALAEGKVR